MASSWVDSFDFRNPDYPSVLLRRLELLRKMRDPKEGAFNVALLKAYYRENPWQLVTDWGMTFDPRLIPRGLPATVPFIPFRRQTELMQWIYASWKGSQDGLVPKSRDTGASWCAIALSCSLCLTYEGMAIGFGSRKEEYVDRLDSPKSLFYKARVFMQNLPIELRGGWQRDKHGTYMRITFPATGSVMTGEAGDNIGRGDRTAIYFVDEAAHLERPQLAEEALSATTNCRIDMSSVRGMNGPFPKKAHSWPKDRIFIIHWRDDPRKDEAWYENLKLTKDPIVIAQEFDINYSASVAGVVIPNEWVQAAIDADVKLGLKVSGDKRGGLDVADEGPDVNAFAARHGIKLFFVEPHSGTGSDIYATTEWAHDICESEGLSGYRYDGDGLGAGVRGDARKIQDERGTSLGVEPFRGSASPLHPEKLIEEIDQTDDKEKRDPRTNEDYFKNAKAQGWWALRFRFLRTYRAVVHGHPVTDPDALISISSRIPRLAELCAELSQPTYSENGAGKLLIDKSPDGTKSPNLADSVMIVFAPAEPKRSGFFD